MHDLGTVRLSECSDPHESLVCSCAENAAYIPAPNTASGSFATSAYNQVLRDDKGAVRIDTNNRVGLLSAYYFIDDFSLNNPYPVAQSGASVPGFSALTTGRAQLIALGDTKTFNATAFNELHLSYTRDDTISASHLVVST
jgi:hypothetical protein